MAIGGNGGNTWSYFLAGLIRRDLAIKCVEYAARVCEHGLHALRGPFAHLGIVHEILPLRRRDHDLRVRECRLVVSRQQSVDVIAMEMGDDDDIDIIAIYSRRFQVAMELTSRAFGLFKICLARAG